MVGQLNYPVALERLHRWTQNEARYREEAACPVLTVQDWMKEAEEACH